jgi:hypothetical protein
MHAKFMSLGINITRFILNVPTKWRTQFQHILAIIPFLALQCLNFSILFLYIIGLNFIYVSPHDIPKVQKNAHIFCLTEPLSNLFL